MRTLFFLFGSIIQRVSAQPSLVNENMDESVYTQYCEATGFEHCSAGSSLVKLIAWRAAFFVFELVGGLAVIAIIWGMMKMITSGVNEQGKEDGKTIIKFALIGLVLSFIASVASRFICVEVVQWTNGDPSVLCPEIF